MPTVRDTGHRRTCCCCGIEVFFVRVEERVGLVVIDFLM
jgi:hypothetical protein